MVRVVGGLEPLTTGVMVADTLQVRVFVFVHLLGISQSFWKRGSLRNGSHRALIRRSPTVSPLGTSRRRGIAAMAESISPVCAWTIANEVSAKGLTKASPS